MGVPRRWVNEGLCKSAWAGPRERSHCKILTVGAGRRDSKPRSLRKGQVGLDVEGRRRAQIWGLLRDLFPIELVTPLFLPPVPPSLPPLSLDSFLPSHLLPFFSSFLSSFFSPLLPDTREGAVKKDLYPRAVFTSHNTRM